MREFGLRHNEQPEEADSPYPDDYGTKRPAPQTMARSPLVAPPAPSLARRVPDFALVKAILAKLSDAQLQQVLEEMPAYQRIRALERSENTADTTPQAPDTTEDVEDTESAEDTGANKRKSKRTKTLHLGKIVYNNKMSVNDCQIRNMSSSGCFIRVESTLNIPKYFTLHILNSNVKHQCESVWRTSTTIGLKYL